MLAEVIDDPGNTVTRRLWSGLMFVFGENWFRKENLAQTTAGMEVVTPPDWIGSITEGVLRVSLLIMIFLGLLGWRFSFGWRKQARLAALAAIWAPLPVYTYARRSPVRPAPTARRGLVNLRRLRDSVRLSRRAPPAVESRRICQRQGNRVVGRWLGNKVQRRRGILSATQEACFSWVHKGKLPQLGWWPAQMGKIGRIEDNGAVSVF